MQNKTKRAVIQRAIQARDESWSALVRIEGTKIDAMIPFQSEPKIGARLTVVGNGSNWSAA